MSIPSRQSSHILHGNSPNFLNLLPLPDQAQASGENPDHHSKSLPGYPDIVTDDYPTLLDFLLEDLRCKDLDQISDHLWLMTEQRSANISPLHRQRVKGRDIVVTEEAKLHLIWFYDKIYIKPMPRYLLSETFWSRCLLKHGNLPGPMQNIIFPSALGFIRSYAHLIKYESDFRIAQTESLALIPNDVSWSQWRILRAKILMIGDNHVSRRFRFGEIRLTRLNFYSKFLLYKPWYYRQYRQYGDYFASFYPPLLFIFGIISIMLGAMQLAVSIEQYDVRWRGLTGVFRASSAFVIFLTTLLLLAFISLLMYKITKEWIFALGTRYSTSKKKERRN